MALEENLLRYFYFFLTATMRDTTHALRELLVEKTFGNFFLS